jgi:Asp/Glu/hydantoin racemase
MTQLLLINPNTSQRVTDLLSAHAKSVAGPEVQIRTITARFGAPYISCEASYAIAAHATLDAWASDLLGNWPAADAVLIGCFGDPGLVALRETSSAAVAGLAQAAMTEARHYGKFSIVTGGERWKPILFRLAHTLAMDSQLVGIHTVAPTGAQLAQNPSAALMLMHQACRVAIDTDGCKALILGGAGLAGIAAQLQDEFSIPIIDSVSAGVRQAIIGIGNVQMRGQNKFNFDWPKALAAFESTEKFN